jgi:predicted nucleotidyltransferase
VVGFDAGSRRARRGTLDADGAAPHSPPVTAGRPDQSIAASTQAALQFAHALARASTRALGNTVAGVLLHGSLTLDDYRPGRSDIDLLVVVDDPLSETQAAALSGAVGDARPRATTRVDLRVVTRAVAAAPSPAPPMEVEIRIDPRRQPSLQAHGRHPGERDLVVEFSICRVHGRSILGASPAELIGDVPHKWVLDVGDAQLADWQAIGDDPRYAELTVLTACRLWRFAETGEHCSKAAAGAWALERHPSLRAVRDALDQREGDPTPRIDAADVQHLLALVRGRVAQRRPR